MKADLEGAISDYQQAVRLDAKDAGAYRELGTVWGEKGDVDNAIRYLSRAIELDPADAIAGATGRRP